MKARNKHTGTLCEVSWNMCDVGRKCEATDKPITPGLPCHDYNAVVDDYEFDVNNNGNWIEGLDFVKNPFIYIDEQDRLIQPKDSLIQSWLRLIRIHVRLIQKHIRLVIEKIIIQPTKYIRQ